VIVITTMMMIIVIIRMIHFIIQIVLDILVCGNTNSKSSSVTIIKFLNTIKILDSKYN